MMSPSAPAAAASPVLRPIAHFQGTRNHPSPRERLEHVKAQARIFREEMLRGPEVTFYASLDLVRLPYPAKYALRDACTAWTPYVHILNRMFVIQFDTQEGLKTLLVSPTDTDGARETPFLKRMAQGMGRLQPWIEPWFAPTLGSVESGLARVGLKPEEVDYITYDHLHTQDVRKWVGAPGKPAYFPKAKLLVMRREWETAKGTIPPKAEWYCPDGLSGVPEERVVLLDEEIVLGESVALVQTPGHTEGNHSIVAHTADGLLVTSENGVGPDAYAPLQSRIPGVQRYAKVTGMEVILNGNTLEGSLDQYISMIQEREIAGPSPKDPRFFNVVTSSELTGYWAFPGVKPAFTFGELTYGTLRHVNGTGD